jgi:two-component system, OmpR family, sensor histidine kinase ArlS
MNIKHRLTLNFTLWVGGLLLLFSFIIYFFSLKHKQEDFENRLKNRAISKVKLLREHRFSTQQLKLIEQGEVSSMGNLCIVIADSAKNYMYSNKDISQAEKYLGLFQNLDWNKSNTFEFQQNLFVCFPYVINNQKVYLFASGKDIFGNAEIRKLGLILIISFVISLLLVVAVGYFYANQSLRPIKYISNQFNTIEAANLDIELKTNNNDEIEELAQTFNRMLKRIKRAFEREKFFVSNVSHELRTPITAIKGQIEVALMKSRKESDYIHTLNSIHEDIEEFTNIINGFIELAAANTDSGKISMKPIRTDEFLFEIKDGAAKRNPTYTIDIEFNKTPEEESEICIYANPLLLSIMINNLIDNACKFSPDKKALILIGYTMDNVIISISDNGIGIPKNEQNSVFYPLYRAKNVSPKSGHGLGLSMVERIAEIHQAKIEVQSEENKGTKISLLFPKKKLTV